jgi:hypothetical protein
MLHGSSTAEGESHCFRIVFSMAPRLEHAYLLDRSGLDQIVPSASPACSFSCCLQE